MDYLTVKEVAELKGCSERYIRTQIQNGKIKAEKTTNASNGHESYLVSVSSLSEDLQAKYYNKLKKEVGTAPELIESEPLKQHKNAVKKRFEEYSQAEREEMAEWIRILDEWKELRAGYKKKTDFDADFVGKCRIEHPELNVSIDILYRKYNAYVNNDYDVDDDRKKRCLFRFIR